MGLVAVVGTKIWNIAITREDSVGQCCSKGRLRRAYTIRCTSVSLLFTGLSLGIITPPQIVHVIQHREHKFIKAFIFQKNILLEGLSIVILHDHNLLNKFFLTNRYHLSEQPV